ncbi:hypothetical protein VTK26DRAFT_2308 [Humicola hyalothermophila]
MTDGSNLSRIGSLIIPPAVDTCSQRQDRQRWQFLHHQSCWPTPTARQCAQVVHYPLWKIMTEDRSPLNHSRRRSTQYMSLHSAYSAPCSTHHLTAGVTIASSLSRSPSFAAFLAYVLLITSAPTSRPSTISILLPHKSLLLPPTPPNPSAFHRSSRYLLCSSASPHSSPVRIVTRSFARAKNGSSASCIACIFSALAGLGSGGGP